MEKESGGIMMELYTLEDGGRISKLKKEKSIGCNKITLTNSTKSRMMKREMK